MRKSLALAFALLALFASSYLWWSYASPAHSMLCIGNGCDVVRASRYSHVFGYPVPMFGVLLYTLLTVLIVAEPLVAPARELRLRYLIAALAAAGFAAAAGLTAIEAFVIHAWCAWCVAQAISITLLFAVWLTLLGSPAYADAAPGRRVLRQHTLVLTVALAVGAPGFLALIRHVELPPPAPAVTTAEAQQLLLRPDSYVTGNPQAAVTLVEFGDLQCPACVAAHPTMEKLRQQFGDRVRFVFRQYPLERIHAYALHAAEATECAGQQGKFWQALDRLYKAEGDLKDASLERYARELGLDMTSYHACLADPATAARIQRDVADGHALGVRGTPTFFLGNERIEGPLDYAQFAQLLNRELARAGSTPKAVQASDAEAQPGNAPAKPAAKVEHGPEKAAPQAAPGFGAGGPLAFNTVQGGSTNCSDIAPAGPEPKMIHMPEAQASFRKGALFVDVRSAADFAKGHIEGARNLPLLEAEHRATELPKDRPIVLYESSGGASSDACAASRAVGRVLLSHGYKDVVVYQDGFAGWQKAALPTSP